MAEERGEKRTAKKRYMRIKLMRKKNNIAEKEINLSQTNSPLVSVIIPCYNAERYVESVVRSIKCGRCVQF